MIHFLPEADALSITPPADAMARVAGLSHALAAAERLNGDEASREPNAAIAAAWTTATEGKLALFDAMSAHAVAGSVAGLEVLGTLRDAGLEANRAAIATLTASIRGEIDRLGMLLTL